MKLIQRIVEIYKDCRGRELPVPTKPPCPFCGSGPDRHHLITLRNQGGPGGGGINGYQVGCAACHARGPSVLHRDGTMDGIALSSRAVKLWRKRP